MNWLLKAKEIFVKAASIRKPEADLSIDEQWARLEKHLAQENATHQHQLENQYPAGFFRLVGTRGGQELAHYCPKCKQLTQLSAPGQVAVHCSGRKRDKAPKGWRLIFVKPAFVRL